MPVHWLPYKTTECLLNHLTDDVSPLAGFRKQCSCLLRQLPVHHYARRLQPGVGHGRAWANRASLRASAPQHFGVRAGPGDVPVRISGGFGSVAALIWQVSRSSWLSARLACALHEVGASYFGEANANHWMHKSFGPHVHSAPWLLAIIVYVFSFSSFSH